MIAELSSTQSRALFVAAVAAVMAPACSLTLDVDGVQCEQSADCAELGFEGYDCVDSLCVEPINTQFSCRDVEWPDGSSEVVDFSLTVVDLVGRTPYEGLPIAACPSLDATCQSPLMETVTDASGSFTLPLQEGFRGHLFAAPPDADPTLAPQNVHIFPPPSNDPSVPVRAGFVVTSLPVVSGLAQLAGRTIQPGTGHAFFTAIGCDGEPLAGVTVSSSVLGEETFVSYLGTSGQPDLSLLGTGANGQGAILNLPAGFVTVRGVHETEGKIFEQSIIVAADTITSVPVVPSPVE